jgi:hypothetical protein
MKTYQIAFNVKDAQGRNLYQTVKAFGLKQEGSNLVHLLDWTDDQIATLVFSSGVLEVRQTDSTLT